MYHRKQKAAARGAVSSLASRASAQSVLGSGICIHSGEDLAAPAPATNDEQEQEHSIEMMCDVAAAQNVDIATTTQVATRGASRQPVPNRYPTQHLGGEKSHSTHGDYEDEAGTLGNV